MATRPQPKNLNLLNNLKNNGGLDGVNPNFASTPPTTVQRPVNKLTGQPILGTPQQETTTTITNSIPSPTIKTPTTSRNNTFGDFGGASGVQGTQTGLQATTKTPQQFDTSTLTFGQGARDRASQTPEYLTQRNDYLAQDLLGKNITNKSQIFDYLNETYTDYSGSDISDRQNTAQAIANRIGQIQQEQSQQETIEEYRARVQQEAQAAAGQAQQDMMQDRQRAGVVGQDRPLEDLERQKKLQQQAIDRSLEQTRFAINNQIEDVALQAQRNLDMGDKIGALKGFNRSGGYIAGLKNIRNDADKAISRLQEQLAFAEKYAGADKAQIMEDFNRSVSRVHEDFAYQTRALRENATISLKEISSKYGLSEEKMAVELEKVAFSFSQQAEQLVGQYITNTRNAIQVTNDQIDVLANYDRFLEQQTERFTNILNMDDGAALSTMTRNDIDMASKDGRLLPEQAQAYKQLMIGKAVNTLSSMGIPSPEDVRNLMTQIQGGISPAAALMQIIGNNPSRYTAQQDQFMTVGANSMIFDAKTGQFITPPTQQSGGNQNYQGPVIPPAQPEKLQESFRKYANMADGSKVRGGQCGEFVNDYLKEMGVAMKFVDPIDVRATQTNSQTPTKGSVVVMTSNSSDLAAKYGHVGIVTNVNADGSFTIKDQNGKNKLAVGTMTIPAGDPRVKGFFDPRLGLGGQNDMNMQVISLTQGLGGTESERSKMQENIVNIAQRDGISLQEAKKKLGYKSSDDIEFAKSRKEQLSSITKSGEAIRNGKQTLNLLDSENTAIGDVSVVFSFLKTLDPASVARESEVESVVSAQSLLGRLEASMSKLKSGKTLATEQRNQMKTAIGTIVNAYENNLRDTVVGFQQEFDERGLDASVYIPKTLINKYVNPQQNTPQTPTPNRQRADELLNSFGL